MGLFQFFKVHFGFKIFLVFLLLSISATSLYAKTTTFTGSGNWGDAGNWSDGVPSDGDVININGNCTIPGNNTDYTLTGTVTITVSSSGYLLIEKQCDLELTSTNSTVYVESGGTIRGTHGNSSLKIGGSGNLLSNNTYNGVNTANVNGWTTSSEPLPVALIQFSAERINGQVKLEWGTASEINNDYFVVEKWDGHSFWEEVTTVSGQGTSNEKQTYTFWDDQSNPSITEYYRLKQVDFDGSSETFDAVSVEAEEFLGSVLTIIQSSNRIDLYSTLSEHHEWQINLLGPQGQILYNQDMVLISSQEVYSLDLSTYPSGWYVLIAQSGENVIQRKFIK